MADEVKLDTASERIALGQEAGTTYAGKLSSIATELRADKGVDLGTMVSSQLKLTESETNYQVTGGIAKAGSGKVKEAAGEVKKVGG